MSLPFALNEGGKKELSMALFLVIANIENKGGELGLINKLQLTSKSIKEKKIMALSDYSDLEREISEAPEPTVLPRGSEVKARVIAVRSGISDKNGCTWYQPVYDVPADPMVTEFNDFFWDLIDAREKVEPKQYARNLNRFKKFAAAFGLDYSRPFDWGDDLVGLEGWVILGFKKDDEFGDKNTVSQYQAPSRGRGSGGLTDKNKDELPF